MENDPHSLQVLTLPVSMSDASIDYMAALTNQKGPISLILQISSSEVIRSIGMIGIPTGIVTAMDVGRVIEAATALSCDKDVVMLTSVSSSFLMDGLIQTDSIPVGLPAKRLEVTVALVHLPKGILKRWHEWAAALDRTIVSWRIEELIAI